MDSQRKLARACTRSLAMRSSLLAWSWMALGLTWESPKGLGLPR